MLYTTEQIAEMYSGEEKNITPYMITHSWIPQGLRHIKGKGKGFLYKKEWVEEFLETQSERTITQQKQHKNKIRKIANYNYSDCKVV